MLMNAWRLGTKSLGIALLATNLVWSAEAALKGEPPPQPSAEQTAELTKLIVQLGDESYAKREAAGDRILELGLVSLKAVEDGAKNSDREIRYRSERLKAMLFDRELQRRLEAFASDVNGEKDHGLPAWDRFAKTYGSDGESRKLFVEIFRAEPNLLKAMQNVNSQTADLVAARAFELQQLVQTQTQLSIGTVAGLLFAATDPEIQTTDQTQQMIFNYCYQQSVRDAATGGPDKRREPVRKLLGAYIAKGEGWVAYQGMTVAMQYDMKEGLIPARKLVKSRGNGQPHLLQQTLLMVAKMGGSEDLKDIEALLDDKTVIVNFQINNQRITGQVRDVALVAAAYLVSRDKEAVKGTTLEKGDLKEFGFKRIEPNPMTIYAPHTIGFESDQARDEVFTKWKEVREKIKLKEEKK